MFTVVAGVVVRVAAAWESRLAVNNTAQMIRTLTSGTLELIGVGLGTLMRSTVVQAPTVCIRLRRFAATADRSARQPSREIEKAMSGLP
jgi:hypothetical protein